MERTYHCNRVSNQSQDEMKREIEKVCLCLDSITEYLAKKGKKNKSLSYYTSRNVDLKKQFGIKYLAIIIYLLIMLSYIVLFNSHNKLVLFLSIIVAPIAFVYIGVTSNFLVLHKERIKYVEKQFLTYPAVKICFYESSILLEHKHHDEDKIEIKLSYSSYESLYYSKDYIIFKTKGGPGFIFILRAWFDSNETFLECQEYMVNKLKDGECLILADK